MQGCLYKLRQSGNTPVHFPTGASLDESEYVIANFFIEKSSDLGYLSKETLEMIGSVKFEKNGREVKKEARVSLFTRQTTGDKGWWQKLFESFSIFTRFDFKQLSIITHAEPS